MSMEIYYMHCNQMEAGHLSSRAVTSVTNVSHKEALSLALEAGSPLARARVFTGTEPSEAQQRPCLIISRLLSLPWLFLNFTFINTLAAAPGDIKSVAGSRGRAFLTLAPSFVRVSQARR